MFEPSGLGRSLIILGLVLVAIGGLIVLAGKVPWIGRLPGDIYVKKERFVFYFPLATSIIISLALSLVLWVINRRR
jgi:hypothetical protein